jgi:hypothetical protein
MSDVVGVICYVKRYLCGRCSVEVSPRKRLRRVIILSVSRYIEVDVGRSGCGNYCGYRS